MLALSIVLGYCVAGLLTAFGIFVYEIRKGNYTDKLEKNLVHTSMIFWGVLWCYFIFFQLIVLCFKIVEKISNKRKEKENRSYVESGIEALERELQKH